MARLRAHVRPARASDAPEAVALLRRSIEEGLVPGLIYHVAADSWGKGHATEVAGALLRFGFDEGRFDSICSWTPRSNLASRRVMEKCGLTFEREGSFKDLPHLFYRADLVSPGSNRWAMETVQWR